MLAVGPTRTESARGGTDPLRKASSRYCVVRRLNVDVSRCRRSLLVNTAQPRLPASVPTFVSICCVLYLYMVLCACMRASSLRSFVDMRVASSRREASPRPVADTPSPPRPARSDSAFAS